MADAARSDDELGSHFDGYITHVGVLLRITPPLYPPDRHRHGDAISRYRGSSLSDLRYLAVPDSIEEDVFANSLNPGSIEHHRWKELLSDDLREPTLRTPLREAIARRFRRIYLPLVTVLIAAWIIRLTVFEHVTGLTDAAIGRIPGVLVVAGVGLFFISLLLLSFWPLERHAKGELRTDRANAEWREWKD